MFEGASNLAAGVDKAFDFIFYISAFFIIGITGFMVFILFKFARKRHKQPQQFRGSVKLEVLWTLIPTIIALLMFYYGWQGFKPMREVPKGAMEVNAIGRMWEWEFDYGNGKRSKELVLPVNRNVKLNLISEDVNHSLAIPAFRVKEDVVPGYKNYLWFKPTKLGDYDIYCTEYCGLNHSGMLSKAKILDSAAYNQWLAELKVTKVLPSSEGLALMKKNNCLSCHSMSGAKVVGPPLNGIFGKKSLVVTSSGEKEITIDEAYLKRSILSPNDEVVKGFPAVMQSYKGVVSDEDIQKMVDYLKAQDAE